MYRLALALGQPNPDRMLEDMPARVLDEWIAFNQVDPIGASRGDLQAGIIAAAVVNAINNLIYAWTGERLDRRKPDDFMPEFKARTPKRQQSPKEIYETLKAALFMGRGKT